MKEVKDLFSVQSATYAAFRPVYPDALYDFLFSVSPAFDTVWDCGTGNGQVATRLSEKFGRRSVKRRPLRRCNPGADRNSPLRVHHAPARPAEIPRSRASVARGTIG